MKTLLSACGTVLLLLSPVVEASGPVGYCGIIEQVVFAGGEDDAERMQIVGAFATSLTDEQGRVRGFGVEMLGAGRFRVPVSQGYLYFSMPEEVTGQERELLRREWRDLAALAGTGEAICFGVYDSSWFTAGGAAGPPASHPRVRDSAEALANPAPYRSAGVGLIKLGSGNYDELVADLRALLNR